MVTILFPSRTSMRVSGGARRSLTSGRGGSLLAGGGAARAAEERASMTATVAQNGGAFHRNAWQRASRLLDADAFVRLFWVTLAPMHIEFVGPHSIFCR
jgi:hypothetical protein